MENLLNHIQNRISDYETNMVDAENQLEKEYWLGRLDEANSVFIHLTNTIS